ncbi:MULTISPECIES: hypothetical protein [unclassified Microcoleus]|uniref:hypothetical protein n=1 Tax=unclassified Microcoleus TaxID=2642155 RepID=UPI002FD710EC
MKVLVDTNTILDSLLELEPFVEDADALFEAIAPYLKKQFLKPTHLVQYCWILYPS